MGETTDPDACDQLHQIGDASWRVPEPRVITARKGGIVVHYTLLYRSSDNSQARKEKSLAILRNDALPIVENSVTPSEFSGHRAPKANKSTAQISVGLASVA